MHTVHLLRCPRPLHLCSRYMQLETDLVSVERVMEYADLPREADAVDTGGDDSSAAVVSTPRPLVPLRSRRGCSLATPTELPSLSLSLLGGLRGDCWA